MTPTTNASGTVMVFVLSCADAHAIHCDAVFRSPVQEDVIAEARAHGATSHGFTASWYSAERLAAMSAHCDHLFERKATMDYATVSTASASTDAPISPMTAAVVAEPHLPSA
jgi:uncharacterized protein DUF1059